MKRIVFIALLLLLASGCSTYGRYGPTLFELAELRAAKVTAPDGTVTKLKTIISDQDVLNRANTIERVWEKKDSISYGYSIGTALTQVGLGFVPTIAGFFMDATGIGAAVNAGSTLLGKFVEVLNPDTASQAYSEGKNMIADGRDSYLIAHKDQPIQDDKLSDEGRQFAKLQDCAIRVVETAQARGISRAADVSCATGGR